MINAPQYDIIVFHSNDDVTSTLNWFDRLYNVLLDQIGMLEAAINAIKVASDRDTSISKQLTYMSNQAGSNEASYGSIPEISVFMGFHTSDLSSIPDPRKFLDELLNQRIRMLETVYGGRKKIQGLTASIMMGGRPVILIWESMWYIFGTRYLFSPVDAQEYFCLKGECSQQSFPFLWYDPYFSSIGALSMGDVTAGGNYN